MGAVIGMHIPADVGEDAGGLAQSRLCRCLADHVWRKERRGPRLQLAAMLRKARQPIGEIARAFDQRILGLFALVEMIEQNTFAQAIGRNHNVFGFHRRYELVEDQRAHRQRIDAAL